MSLEELWRQVADSPDDLAPRLVLADALVESGDNRGELIHLQCAPVRGWSYAEATERARALVADNWQRWLGRLAQILDARTSWFDRGMLDVVHVGGGRASRRAWTAALGHRELAVVRRVSPATCTMGDYVDFVLALPNQPRSLRVRDRAELLELVRRRVRWSTRVLHAETAELDGIDGWFPELERLEIISSQSRLLTLVPQLATAFRGLHSIVIHDYERSLHALRAIPIVELR
jgi:uncharacterized protein (TIGR02996 family)